MNVLRSRPPQILIHPFRRLIYLHRTSHKSLWNFWRWQLVLVYLVSNESVRYHGNFVRSQIKKGFDFRMGFKCQSTFEYIQCALWMRTFFDTYIFYQISNKLYGWSDKKLMCAFLWNDKLLESIKSNIAYIQLFFTFDNAKQMAQTKLKMRIKLSFREELRIYTSTIHAIFNQLNVKVRQKIAEFH